jgi:hypothetical protein
MWFGAHGGLAFLRSRRQGRLSAAAALMAPGATIRLKISLAGAEDKLAQIDRRTRAAATTDLGMPAPARHT